MPEVIIDGFEPIQIQQQHCDPRRVAVGIDERLVQPLRGARVKVDAAQACEVPERREVVELRSLLER